MYVFFRIQWSFVDHDTMQYGTYYHYHTCSHSNSVSHVIHRIEFDALWIYSSMLTPLIQMKMKKMKNIHLLPSNELNLNSHIHPSILIMENIFPRNLQFQEDTFQSVNVHSWLQLLLKFPIQTPHLPQPVHLVHFHKSNKFHYLNIQQKRFIFSSRKHLGFFHKKRHFVIVKESKRRRQCEF